jgi:uncharacterized protein YegJ (DUF2314 family)
VRHAHSNSLLGAHAAIKGKRNAAIYHDRRRTRCHRHSGFVSVRRAKRPGKIAKRRDGHPSLALKVGIPYSDNNVEYLWVNPFEARGDVFVGRVNNDPVWAKNIKYRQMIEFDESNIADWMYRDNGKMKGNHTTCALLRRDTPKNREAFRKEYGLECEP